MTRLWSPCHNLATTLSQLCSIFTIPLQPCSHIVYSFTSLSQPCHNLVVYSQSHCNLAATFHKVVTSLPQPFHNLAATLSIPSQGCHNHAIISQAHYNLMTTSCLSQACHNLVIFSPPHRKPVTTLQACDKVTHVHLMIFILTKTQRKSIEIHST